VALGERVGQRDVDQRFRFGCGQVVLVSDGFHVRAPVSMNDAMDAILTSSGFLINWAIPKSLSIKS
jgi:hypothetical protein